MANVGSAYVLLMPSMKGFASSLAGDFGGAGSKAGSSFGSGLTKGVSPAASKTSGIMSGIGTVAKKAAKVGAAGFAAVGSAAVVAGKMALDSYGDYEQLVGGVDTLFGSASKKLQGYASESFRTAGISANQYMTQATSFAASLVSSVGGDTSRAADLANLAMVSMADNVNKMGSSMESVQWAYQGFAKQNYTMLDNLKLGYGGTKSEMERLIKDANKLPGVLKSGNDLSIDSFADVVEAIARVQQNMGITGTTAKEAATTIQGSIGMAKAAWQDFLTGLGRDDADFTVLTKNLLEAIGAVATNVAPRVAQIGAGIIKAFPPVLAGLGNILAPIVTKALSGAWDVAAQALESIGIKLPSVDGSQLLSSAKAVGAQAAAVLAAALAGGSALAGVKKGASALSGLSTKLVVAKDSATSFLDAINGASTVSPVVAKMSAGTRTALMQVASGLGTAGSGFTGFAGTVTGSISGLAGKVGAKLAPVANVVTAPFSAVGGKVSSILAGLGGKVSSGVTSALGKATGALSSFGGKVASAMSPVTSVLSGIGSKIGAAFAPLGSALSSVFGGLGQVGSGLVALVGPAALVVAAVAAVAAGFAYMMSTNEGFRSSVMQCVSAIGAGLQPALTALQGAVAAAQPVIAQVVAFVLGSVLPALGSVGLAILEVAAKLAPVVGDILATVIPAVTQLAGILVSVLGAAFSAVSAVVSAVWPVVESVLTNGMEAVLGVVNAVWPAMKTVIQTTMKVIQDVVKVVTAAIKGDWTGVWNGIKRLLSDVMNGAVSIVNASLNAMRGVVNSVLGAVQNVWNATWRTLANILNGAWNGFVSSVSGGSSRVMSVLGNLPGRIIGLFAGAGSWLIGSGRSLLNGLISGIQSGFNRAIGAVKSGLSKIRAFFPFSPAKVGPFSGHGYTTFSGKALMGDFAESIAAQGGRVSGAVESVLSAAQDGMTARLSVAPERPARVSRAGDLSGDDAFGEAVRLLQRIADKDQNVYMDSTKVSAALTARSRYAMAGRGIA